jgi:2-hydroxycyclohexanecarboxyl-CoA dehydrogenase
LVSGFDGGGSRRGRVVGEDPLPLTPGLAGCECGDEADEAVDAEEQRRTYPSHAHEQQGGDEGGEPGHHRRDLVGQRRARRTGLRLEQFREPGALHAGKGVLTYPVRHHEGDHYQHEQPGVDQQEHRYAEEDDERADRQVDRLAADAVRERTPEGCRDYANSCSDTKRDQGGLFVRDLSGVDVGDHVRDRHGVAGGLRDTESDAAQDVAPVLSDHLNDRRLHDLARAFDFFEDWRLWDLGADDEAHYYEQDRCEEWHAPGPITRQHAAAEEDEVGQEEPDRESGLHEPCEEAFAFPRRVLVGHQNGSAPLGSEGEALHDSDNDEQGRREHSHHGVGRQQADGECCQTHNDQRHHQHGLPPDLVAEMPPDDSAEGPSRESDAQCREGSEGSGDRVGAGEKYGAEVQCGGSPESDEIVRFDHGADTRTECDAFDVFGALHGPPHGQSVFAHVNTFPSDDSRRRRWLKYRFRSTPCQLLNVDRQHQGDILRWSMATSSPRADGSRLFLPKGNPMSAVRTAVVTGAASARGIGRGVARRYARDGWGVVILDIDGEAAVAAAADIANEFGVPTFGHLIDVADESSVDAAYQSVLEKVAGGQLPELGAIVNIAGITSPVPFLETTLDIWNRVMAVNATGTYLVTKAFLPQLLEARWGRIIVMSSVSAQRGGGVFGKVPYSSAKSALLGFTKALARELEDSGVTINAVAPGAVDTDIRVGSTDEQEASIAASIPLGRTATVEEVSGVIAFLSSEDASYLTGTTIDINGGSHLH